jgi:ATP-dependent DNA helicase DinG
LAYLLLSSWILETDKGYWDEIPYWFKKRISKEIEGNICNVDELCTKDTCNFHKEQKCFLAKARAKARDADIIIANHALTLLEISTEDVASHTIFPETAKFVVFDEAHYLEKAGTSAFERTISEDIIFYLLQQVNKLKEKSLTFNIDNLFNKILPQVIKTNSNGYTDDVLFHSLRGIAQKEISTNLENIKLDLINIKKEIDNSIEKAGDDKFFKISKKTVVNLIESINIFLSKDNDYIKYIERNGDNIQIKVAPLSAAQYLKKYVYSAFSSVVFTSATLTVNKEFKFFAKRCGILEIKEDKIDYYLLESCFDYEKQVKFFVPSGISYKRERTEEHLEKSINFLEKALIASNGGALVLCTSYKQIDRIYNSLIVPLSKNNITLLRQDKNYSPKSIVKAFEEDINSVLIGTDTFWHGIDVPGQSLRNLFILKIPHDAPSSIIKSRKELCDNPYLEYVAPTTAIKLKQGFGRLIRKSTDYGVTVLLDDNFIKESILINSLPFGVNVEKKSVEEILEELK